MKRIYLIVFSLAAFAFFSTDAMAITKMELYGQLIIGQTRSVTSADSTSTSSSEVSEPIEAYNYSSGIYTAFNADLGYVLIEVVSFYTEEVVYSTMVDSGSEDSFIAPDGIDLNSGDYYIRYTTVYGDASGDIY
jgi:hypothetical protein